MDIKIGITEPSDFSQKALDKLRCAGTVSLYDAGEQELQSFISDKDAIFVRLKYKWDEKTLQNAGSLKYICSPATGLTHIDTAYALQKGISVISLKGETGFLKTIPATAEHAFALAAALLRRYVHAFVSGTDPDWNRDKYKGYEIKGMRAGIIGMGRIGGLLSGYLKAFGADVLYYDTNPDAENLHGAKRADSIISLIDAADIIFLCASYSDDNRHMINAGHLMQMKDKYFINTARGELVDEDTLLKLIQDGHFAGVALDVLDGEPEPKNLTRFASLSSKHNFILTPHIGGATISSMRATEEFITDKLINILNTR